MKKLRIKRYIVSAPADIEYLVIAILLLVIGLIILLSASYPSAYYEMGNPYYYFIRQSEFAAIGIVAMFVASKIDYHVWRWWAVLLLFAAFLALVAVLIPGIGALRNNARRWIDVFGVHFQPSELAKFAVIIDFSASIARKKDQMRTWKKGILPYMVKLACLVGLLALEPHLSGAILIVLIGAVLLFVGGVRLRWVVLGLCAGGVFVWLLLSGHITYGQNRIDMWLNPFIDAQGDGYQLSQSLIAIGSGGLTGLGLGKSRQKFLYLPEEHNDFIFSILCEELGLIGAALIIIVFMLFIIRGYTIARNAKDRFGALLAVGITTHFALQTFMNIGVVTGLLPTTGVSLPFFSYGGTALVFQLLEVGIVLSVSRQTT